MSFEVKGMKELSKALDSLGKSVDFHCVNCGKEYTVDLTKSKTKCPKCRTEMTIKK